jgi:hypothetical protein
MATMMIEQERLEDESAQQFEAQAERIMRV